MALAIVTKFFGFLSVSMGLKSLTCFNYRVSSSSDGKISCIIDLKGLGFKNLDSKAFISGFDIYQVRRLFLVWRFSPAPD